jgi:hypothetical protein
MAMDANEDGGAKNSDAVDASANVNVGSTQMVGFDITSLTVLPAGTGYQAYQVRLEYDNTKLTPVLTASWANCVASPIPVSCNQWSAPGGIFLATGPTDSGSDILVSVTAQTTGSTATGELGYFSFTCKAAGDATLHLAPGAPTDTHILGDDATTYEPAVTDAVIHCQAPGAPKLDRLAAWVVDLVRTVREVAALRQR